MIEWISKLQTGSGLCETDQGLFFLSVFSGIVLTWDRIRKNTLRYWWIFPCSIFYVVSALLSTFTAYIAHDDPADPNFRRYENWGLKDFVLNDIKTLIIWLLIGAALHFVFDRRECKKVIKVGCIALLAFLAVLSAVVILLSITKLS